MSKLATIPTPANPTPADVPLSASPPDPTPPDLPVNPVQPDGFLTPAEYEAEHESDLIAIADLIVKAIDPDSALAMYREIGRRAFLRAVRQKSSIPGKFVKADYDRLCLQLADAVKARVAIERVEVSVYVRTHLIVELLRPHVGDSIDRVSYFTVKQYFLPCLTFDPADLTAEIKADWTSCLVSLVNRIASATPPTLAEIKADIASHAKAIEDAKLATLPLDKQAEQVAKAKDAEIKAARRTAKASIATGIDSAFEGSNLTPVEIMATVADAIKENSKGGPVPIVLDVASMTKNDVQALALAMLQAGKLDMMAMLRDTLGKMLDHTAKTLAQTESAKAA